MRFDWVLKEQEGLTTRRDENQYVFFQRVEIFSFNYRSQTDFYTYLISVFLTSDVSVNTIIGMAKLRKQFL